MGNQYHDERGQFCSADEMGFAVDRLALAGDIDRALKLSVELNSLRRADAMELQARLEAFSTGSGPVAPSGAPVDRAPFDEVGEAGRLDFIREEYAHKGPTVAYYETIRNLNFEQQRAILADPETPEETLEETLAVMKPSHASQATIESRSSRTATAYAVLHGWPANDPDFERQVATGADIHALRLLAVKAQTELGKQAVLTSEEADGPALINLATNPSLTNTEAKQLIDLGGEHVADYRTIRAFLFKNRAVSPYITAKLQASEQALARASRPATIRRDDPHYRQAVEDLQASNRRLLAAMSNPVTSEAQRAKYALAMSRVTRKLENVEAEFNASSEVRVNKLREQRDMHSKQTLEYEVKQRKLDAVDGYLLQRSDFEKIF